MFKRIIILLVVIMSFAFPVNAEKNEWISSTFDFSKCKKILVIYNVDSSIQDEITRRKTTDIFYKSFANTVVNDLNGKGYKIIYKHNIYDNIAKEYNNINFSKLIDMNKEQANKIWQDEVGKYADLVLNVTLYCYNTDSEYAEGYNYTVNKELQYVQGGYFPTVHAAVRFDVYNSKDLSDTGLVWSKIDSRGRMNRGGFDNTTPEDLFKRIIGSFNGDFKNKIS